MAALSGYFWATESHAHLIATVPVIAYCLYRLFVIYGELVERLMFVFHAVQNNDFTFRFTDNPNITRTPWSISHSTASRR